MNENESSYLASLNQKNNNEAKDDINDLNVNNINHLKTNKMIESNKINSEDKEMEELYANLGYKKNNYNYNDLKQRLDSIDSPINAQFKFSIDMPNVSKQRLHEYLNDDLLNALEVSPNIPKLNDEIQNMKINETDNSNNIINNPNSLFGFSLYPPNNINNFDTQNNNNNNQNIKSFSSVTHNNNYIIENTNDNDINNKLKANNINEDLKAYINIENSPMYIPILMRNNEKNQRNNITMNIKQKKNEAKKQTNKFDKERNGEEKNKSNFKVRIGDWTCSTCHNLNFSFRKKCNRCGLPKEISDKQFLEIQKEINIQKITNEKFGYNNPSLIYINGKEIDLYKK